MPWTVSKSDEESKPWAVVKDDGTVEGCYATERDAHKQQAALYASEEDKSVERMHVKAVAQVTGDEGAFEAVISTDDVDRELDVVDPEAMAGALQKWNRPIPLAWNHSTKAEDIFGHINPDAVRVVGGEVVAEGQVHLDSKVGKEAWRLFKARSIGFSFGYIILDGTERKGGGRHITELDVFEVTATPTPMNNTTRVLSTKAHEAQLKQELQTLRYEEEKKDIPAVEPGPDPVEALAKQLEASMKAFEEKQAEVDAKLAELEKPAPPSEDELRREHQQHKFHEEAKGLPEAEPAPDRLDELAGSIEKFGESQSQIVELLKELRKPAPKSEAELRKEHQAHRLSEETKDLPETDPGPSPTEKILSQVEALAGRLDAQKTELDTKFEEVKAAVEQPVKHDSLKRESLKAALEIETGGISSLPRPPMKEPEPKPEPAPAWETEAQIKKEMVDLLREL